MPASVLVSPSLLHLLWSSCWDYHNRHITHLSDPSFPASPLSCSHHSNSNDHIRKWVRPWHTPSRGFPAHSKWLSVLQDSFRFVFLCPHLTPPLPCALQPAWPPSNTEDSPALGFRLCCLLCPVRWFAFPVFPTWTCNPPTIPKLSACIISPHSSYYFLTCYDFTYWACLFLSTGKQYQGVGIFVLLITVSLGSRTVSGRQ